MVGAEKEFADEELTKSYNSNEEFCNGVEGILIFYESMGTAATHKTLEIEVVMTQFSVIIIRHYERFWPVIKAYREINNLAYMEFEKLYTEALKRVPDNISKRKNW